MKDAKGHGGPSEPKIEACTQKDRTPPNFWRIDFTSKRGVRQLRDFNKKEDAQAYLDHLRTGKAIVKPENLITAAQVERGDLPRVITAAIETMKRSMAAGGKLDIGVASEALTVIEHGQKQANDHFDKARSIWANIETRFDVGGKKAFLKKYFPDILERKAYTLLEILQYGPKRLEDLRARQAGYARKARKVAKAAKEHTQKQLADKTAELAAIKSGTADSTLLRDGKPVSKGSSTITAGQKTFNSPQEAHADKDTRPATFAKLVSELAVLTMHSKPATFKPADVKSETLHKLADFFIALAKAKSKKFTDEKVETVSAKPADEKPAAEQQPTA